MIIVAAAAIGITLLLRSAVAGCGFPDPVNTNLPHALRSLGGFDQAMDPSDIAALQSSSVKAATALHPDLIGASATHVVREMQAGVGPSAIVVPLQRPGSSGQQIVALVAFLTDCSGRAYFDAVDDRTRSPQPFPPAQPRTLAHPRLKFYGDPFDPFWG